jgi:hypothetical protein
MFASASADCLQKPGGGCWWPPSGGSLLVQPRSAACRTAGRAERAQVCLSGAPSGCGHSSTGTANALRHGRPRSSGRASRPRARSCTCELRHLARSLPAAPLHAPAARSPPVLGAGMCGARHGQPCLVGRAAPTGEDGSSSCVRRQQQPAEHAGTQQPDPKRPRAVHRPGTAGASSVAWRGLAREPAPELRRRQGMVQSGMFSP